MTDKTALYFINNSTELPVEAVKTVNEMFNREKTYKTTLRQLKIENDDLREDKADLKTKLRWRFVWFLYGVGLGFFICAGITLATMIYGM